MHEGELEGGRSGWLGRLRRRSCLPCRGSIGLVDDLLDEILDAGRLNVWSEQGCQALPKLVQELLCQPLHSMKRDMRPFDSTF